MAAIVENGDRLDRKRISIEAHQLRDIAARLTRFAARLPEYEAAQRRLTRGGFGAGLPEVNVKAPAVESPVPVNDHGHATDLLDRKIAKDDKRIRQIIHSRRYVNDDQKLRGWDGLTALADELDRLLDDLLVMVEAVDQPARTPCGNASCGGVLEDGRLRGECPRCRKWRSRYRLEYPKIPA